MPVVGTVPLYRLLNATRLGWPSAPPASVVPPQVKLVMVFVVPMVFPATPAVAAVTVTVPLLEVAVTPAAGVRVIALTKLAASVVALELMEKFAPVSLPSMPPLRDAAPHAKMLVLFDCPARMPLAVAPSVAAVRLTVLPLAAAVTPTVDAVQALIASARLVAKVAGVTLVI